MAQSAGGRWLTVGKLIELFTAMGCSVSELPGELVGPDGPRRVRYLYSPMTDDFVSLSDLADDERIPSGEIDNWERRLGVTVPRGTPPH